MLLLLLLLVRRMRVIAPRALHRRDVIIR